MQLVSPSEVTEVYQASKMRIRVVNNVDAKVFEISVPLMDGSYTSVFVTSGANAAATQSAIESALNAKDAITDEYTISTNGGTDVDLLQKSAVGPFLPKIIGLISGLDVQVLDTPVTSAHMTPLRYKVTLYKPAAASAGDLYVSRYTAQNARKPGVYKVVSANTTLGTITIDDVMDIRAPSISNRGKITQEAAIVKRTDMDTFEGYDDSKDLTWLNQVLLSLKSGKTRTVTDSSFTVHWFDRHINLASTTSAGNYSAIFSSTVGLDGQRVTVVLPAALGGTDAFVTSGLKTAANAAANKTLDAAGDRIEAVYSASSDKWYILVDAVA